MGRDYFRNFTVDDFLQIPLLEKGNLVPSGSLLPFPGLEGREEERPWERG